VLLPRWLLYLEPILQLDDLRRSSPPESRVGVACSRELKNRGSSPCAITTSQRSNSAAGYTTYTDGCFSAFSSHSQRDRSVISPPVRSEWMRRGIGRSPPARNSRHAASTLSRGKGRLRRTGENSIRACGAEACASLVSVSSRLILANVFAIFVFHGRACSGTRLTGTTGVPSARPSTWRLPPRVQLVNPALWQDRSCQRRRDGTVDRMTVRNSPTRNARNRGDANEGLPPLVLEDAKPPPRR